MAHNDLNLFAQLSGLRILVLANRLGCDGDLARDVHDRLAVLLAEMIADRRRIIASERDYALARLQSEAEDEAFDLHHYRVSFAERWLERPIALLDDAIVDHATGEFFDPTAERWYFCEGILPITVPLKPDALCGLTETIAEIEDVSGATFTIERVYYSEAEAEAAWDESRGENPEDLVGTDALIIF